MVAKSFSKRNEEHGFPGAGGRFDVASSFAATEELGSVIDDTFLVAVEYVAFLAIGDIALEVAKIPFTM